MRKKNVAMLSWCLLALVALVVAMAVAAAGGGRGGGTPVMVVVVDAQTAPPEEKQASSSQQQPIRGVILNEVMQRAANDDDDGGGVPQFQYVNNLNNNNRQANTKSPGRETRDFIEIANIGRSDVDLTGWKIIDSKGEPQLLVGRKAGLVFGSSMCPLKRLRRGGVVALYAAAEEDGENDAGKQQSAAAKKQDPCTLPFHLGKKDNVRLIDNSNRVVDSISWKNNLHEKGHSYGRSPDGYGPWAYLESPTPGRANANYVALDVPGVKEPDFHDETSNSTELMPMTVSRPNLLASLRSKGVENVESFTSNLPIVYLRTQTHIRDEPKILAEMWVSRCTAPPMEAMPLGIFSQGSNKEYIMRRKCSFDDLPDYDGKAGVELRGSSSQRFAKKSMAIKLTDDDGYGNAASLLGMPKDTDWNLHGPSHDASLVRNAFATFAMREGFGRWAARTRLVELFVDSPPAPGSPRGSSAYRGVYLLMEKPERSKYRVDISKRDGDDYRGGYIIKHDNNNVDPGDRVVNTAVTRMPFIIVYPGAPKPASSSSSSSSSPPPNLPIVRMSVTGAAESTEEQLRIVEAQIRAQAARDADVKERAAVKAFLDDFERRLFASDFASTTPSQGRYDDVIDVDSFVDYMLHTELLKNPDGYRGSTYLHKDNNGPLIMGPVWDANEALGNAIAYNAAQTDAVRASGWRFEACINAASCTGDTADGTSRWFVRLMSDPRFYKRASERWVAVRAGPLSDTNVKNWYRTYLIELGAGPAEREYTRWPANSRGELGGACRRGADGATRCGPSLPGFRRRLLQQTVLPTRDGGAAEAWRSEFVRLETWVQDRLNWMDSVLARS